MLLDKDVVNIRRTMHVIVCGRLLLRTIAQTFEGKIFRLPGIDVGIIGGGHYVLKSL